MALADPKTCKHEWLGERRRVSGYVLILFDPNDNDDGDMDFSGRTLGPSPKTVECQNCGKRLPNPRRVAE